MPLWIVVPVKVGFVALVRAPSPAIPQKVPMVVIDGAADGTVFKVTV